MLAESMVFFLGCTIACFVGMLRSCPIHRREASVDVSLPSLVSMLDGRASVVM